MKQLLILMFFLNCLKSSAQADFGKTVADKLEKSDFYFVGQLHNNKSNTIIDKELLFALNRRFNVCNNILEFGHSAAFLLNQYLLTGEDSILSFINSEAKFTFIRSIKSFNDSNENNKKIHFYGIDFENRYDGRLTKKAIQVVLEKLQLKEAGIIYSLLRDIVLSHPQDIKENLKRVRKFLHENEEQCRSLLGNYFLDILLIVNAQYDFSPKRDKAMMSNFKLLYNELVRNGDHPLFYASFGTGHINPKNKNGIAMRLLKETGSPVRNKVSVIGIQYINCRFNKNAVTRLTEGSLNSICKNPLLDIRSRHQNMENITFISKEKLTGMKCNKTIDQYSGIVVVENFAASKFWIWE